MLPSHCWLKICSQRVECLLVFDSRCQKDYLYMWYLEEEVYRLNLLNNHKHHNLHYKCMSLHKLNEKVNRFKKERI